MSDLIRRPYDLYRAGVFDEYLMGLMNQVAQAMDDSITQEVTNHLFKKEGARYKNFVQRLAHNYACHLKYSWIEYIFNNYGLI